ncbi:hypothetical protein [Sulfurovum sp. TSL1]|uniref:hypothetical protein n=1 Tax=Sulfurovum sp. TSL1 TaxID=2826994 RepID=UPI001CC4FA6E|nr:hypothetical protein [Sulfurovum sp. TSL1]
MNFMKKYNILAVMAASLLLLGCGGGSISTDDGNYNPSTDTPPSSMDTPSNTDTSDSMDTSESGDGGDTSTPDQLTAQWSVQIVAEDPESKLLFDNDRFGQLEVASNEVDAYDLKSMPRPFVKNGEGELLPFLSVNFSQEGKNYVTDFHNPELKYDEWTFTVNSNPERTVTLRWNAYTVTSHTDATGRTRFDQTPQTDEDLMGRMQLVDAESNEVLVSAYAEGKLQSYTFNMNGQTARTFRWVLDTEKVPEKVQERSAKSSALYKGASFKQYASEMDTQVDLTILPRPMGQ